jgi:hypothetical protein
MALTSLEDSRADSRSGQLGRQTLSCIKKSVDGASCGRSPEPEVIFAEFNRIGF